MTKIRIRVDYHKVKELARPYFDRMCPNAGSKEQANGQEIMLQAMMQHYDEELCPRIVFTLFEGGYLERNTLYFEHNKIPCPGLDLSLDNMNLKFVITYGISIPELPMEEQEDLLKAYYLDCWMTALLDGTRDWLKVYLQDRYAAPGDRVSDAFGPGFFGISMDTLPEILSMIEGDSIGLKMFYHSLYPAKSNVGFYVVYKGEKEFQTGDCTHCLADRKNCLFCKNYNKEPDSI